MALGRHGVMHRFGLHFLVLFTAEGFEAKACEGQRDDLCLSGGQLGYCFTPSISVSCECTEGYVPMMTKAHILNIYWTCCPGEAADGCRRSIFKRVLGVLLAASLVGIILTTLMINLGLQRIASVNSEDLALFPAQSPRPNGAHLHRQVPMNRWCVSREDLKQFQRLVWRAVQDGYILPQERDLFDPTDCTVGPSMYTVVEQYIKPMTQAAGNVSWALLAHPEGLQCDLFITHCWAEGIFEFVEKATRSWPHGAKAAYICFLSNPQNLDVSHLIQDPAESPFAKALEAAKHVLAIPNSKVSIYTRIWCVYEAFLAHTQGKFILTAKTVKRAFWLQVLRVSFVYLASVTASTWMGSLVSQELTEQFVLPPLILTVLFGIAHLFLCNHYSRFPCITRCVVYLIAISCGVVLGLRLNTPSEIELLAAVFLFFCTGALEADRLEGKEGAQQAANLRNNFTGHLADAECSDDADKRRICAELTNSGQEEAVEEAVAVLMHMNISTPELRSTMLRTGTLGDATSLSGSFMILGMSLFFLQPCAVCIDWYLLVNIFQIHWLCIMLALGILEFLFLSLLLLCYAIWCPDRWTFAVRSQAMWFLILPAEAMTSTLHPEIIANVVAVSIFILGPCILILAILGPARMSRVPIFGAALVRLIYGRAPWKTPCAKCTKPSGTSPRRQ